MKNELPKKPAMIGRTVHVRSAQGDCAVLQALMKQCAGVRVTHANSIQPGDARDAERWESALAEVAGEIRARITKPAAVDALCQFLGVKRFQRGSRGELLRSQRPADAGFTPASHPG